MALSNEHVQFLQDTATSGNVGGDFTIALNAALETRKGLREVVFTWKHVAELRRVAALEDEPYRSECLNALLDDLDDEGRLPQEPRASGRRR